MNRLNYLCIKTSLYLSLVPFAFVLFFVFRNSFTKSRTINKPNQAHISKTMPHKASGKETSRKDKRRTNLENRVRKITDTFINDRDIYYKERLTSLQTDLTTLHQGNNALFQRKLRDLEEDRDYQLVQLRLHEEYRVARSKIEFEEDIKKAKEDYEKLVKLCKERLYAKLEMRVKETEGGTAFDGCCECSFVCYGLQQAALP